jgi:acyl carrier protein
VSNDIRSTISQFIQRDFVFDETEVAADASLLDSGLVDSTGILEVVLFLEEAFEISVEDEEVLPENFDSIERLTAYVERKQRAHRLSIDTLTAAADS